MRIAIASGKGGTGKTMVAVNLAATLSRNHFSSISFLDCDVEAPNAALFLQPHFHSTLNVENLTPQVDRTKCDLCGLCVHGCQFNAITITPKEIFIIPELCHSCGGCTLICPQHAITEIASHAGIIRKGTCANMHFYQGELEIGLPSPVGIINRMFTEHFQDLQNTDTDPLTIVDSPPGVSCPVVASSQGADFVVLVTEPTPFGLHDLRMAVQLVRDEMHLPLGVIINKHDCGTQDVENYCFSAHLPILQRIPFLRHIAEIYAGGQLLLEVLPSFEKDFIQIWKQILSLSTANQRKGEE